LGLTPDDPHADKKGKLKEPVRPRRKEKASVQTGAFFSGLLHWLAPEAFLWASPRRVVCGRKTSVTHERPLGRVAIQSRLNRRPFCGSGLLRCARNDERNGASLPP